MSLASMLAQLTRSSVPVAAPGASTAWVASAALAASGAFTASTAIDVSAARTLNLWLSYQAGVIEGYPQIILMTSAEIGASGKADTPPVLTDDVWFAPQVNDGSVTATLLTGAMPASHDATIAPEWGSQTLRPLVMRLENGDATSDRIRVKIPLKVESDRWAFLLYAEEGATGTPGTLAINYSLSA